MGARRIRTADLLGAMHEGRSKQSRENMLICSAFLRNYESLQGARYAGI
jgi:hypothetical protein